MRVLIDGRPLQGASSVRGIGSYARGLLAGFAELADPPEVSLLALRAPRAAARGERRGSARRRDASGSCIRRSSRSPTRSSWRARCATRTPTCITPSSSDSRCARACPVVVTVHDLIPFVMPRDYPWVRRARILGLRLLRRADAVIAVSEATRRDVLRLTEDAGRSGSRVIPEGIAPVFHAAPAEAVDALRDAARHRPTVPARRGHLRPAQAHRAARRRGPQSPARP